MKGIFFLCGMFFRVIVFAQTVPGYLLYNNNIDSTSKTLLYSINAANCKNSIYLNSDMFTDATAAGYKTYFCINGLAPEDAEAFKEENGFANDYPVIINRELSKTLQSNSVYLLKGTQIVLTTDCDYTQPVHNFLEEEEKAKKEKLVDSIPVDTSYKFYSGSGAYLNDEYCLVMDFRFSRKVHKINMQTGKIVQQFGFDEKQWAEKIYTVLYNGDKGKISKSVKARQLYIKKDRIFNNQEFEPENITSNEGKVILSMRFHLPFINDTGDTLSKNTKVLFQLNDSLQIINYWVAPVKHLDGDFYIPQNSDMTPLLLMGDTVCLSVSYIHYGETPSQKYNYAKFLLDKNHTISFHSYLPFTVPDDKGAITGDYNVPHMYLFKLNTEIVGSYITFPAIYNLSENKKIYDIELIGRAKQLKNKMDSILFAKDVNNLYFLINYFDKYKNKYYLMQCKNGTRNSLVLFDSNMKHIKTSYFSQITTDEGRPFYTKGDTMYFLKFGVKNESDMYIIKRSISNLLSMEID